nr:MAG TPA: hypothetical protein [Caudoviricetes sp.]
MYCVLQSCQFLNRVLRKWCLDICEYQNGMLYEN